MSKAEKVAKQIWDELKPTWTDKKAAEIIRKHLKDAHNEAVDATVMAMNKGKFIKPEYKD